MHDLHLKEIKVTKETLPEYQLQITEDNEISICKNGKFIPNQVKTKTNLYFKALKLCLKLGLELWKKHKLLKFKQTPLLMPYIERNTELQKEAEMEAYKIKKQNARLKKLLYLVNEWKI